MPTSNKTILLRKLVAYRIGRDQWCKKEGNKGQIIREMYICICPIFRTFVGHYTPGSEQWKITDIHFLGCMYHNCSVNVKITKC